MNTDNNDQNNAAAPADVAVAEAPPTHVSVVVKGKIQGAATDVPVGTTLRTALKTAEVAGYADQSYQDDKGKPVSLDRKLTENLEIHAVAKVSGG